jgi:hypothetical protein
MPEAFRDIGIATIGWHCLLCGETVDDVILRNRARPLQASAMDEETIECQSLDPDCEVGAKEEWCVESVFGETLP